LCATLVRPGGRLANIGVHGKPVTLHLEDLWIRDITLTTGLVDTSTTPTLLRMLAAGQLDIQPLLTHRMPLDDMIQAYDRVLPSRGHRRAEDRAGAIDTRSRP
jgi:alcohol dehydrogenase